MIKLKTSSLVACATLAMPLASIHAAALASDNAGNYTAAAGVNDNNYAGRNFGTGFSAFTVSGANGNSANTFLGSSTGNAGGSSGGIDSSNSESFGLFANTGSQVLVNRSFTADAQGQSFLAVGQTFSISLDNGYVTSGATVGFNLLTTAGTDRFTFQFTGGQNDYTFNTGTGSTTVDTQIGYTGNGLRISYTQGAANAFTLTVTPAGGTAQTFTGTTGGTDITQFQVFNNGANGNAAGSNYDVFFNNPAVVPEPGTMAMVGLGALGAWLVARRRRA